MNYETLHEMVTNKEVVAGITKDGTKSRFFIATNGALCTYAKGSSRRGYYIGDVAQYVSFVGKKPEPSPEDKLKADYRVIAKYKKLAMKASFTNPFIEDCKALPDFDDWKRDLVTKDWQGNPIEPHTKSLFELGITTGTGIDGKVISLDRIGKQFPRQIESLREAIKSQTEGSQLSGQKFAGYDISISTQLGKGFNGFLSLEYAGCGNGYYYILINDENFIGYDID